jgi:hypothetical protein
MLGGWFSNSDAPTNGDNETAQTPLVMLDCETPTTRKQYEDLAGRTLEKLIQFEKEGPDDGMMLLNTNRQLVFLITI